MVVWFGLAKQLNVSVGDPITRWRGRCSGAIRLAVLIVFVVNILVSIIEGMFFFRFLALLTIFLHLSLFHSRQPSWPWYMMEEW